MKWYAEYDLDGFIAIYQDDGTRRPDAHQLGPYDTWTEAKNQLLWVLRGCVRELKSTISEVRAKTKPMEVA